MSLWEKSLSLFLPREAEGDMSPYLPELHLRVEGLSDGDDPAKVSVIDCESVEETEY